MRKLITVIMGLLFLGCILISTGCAPMPYQETYYERVEIILVPVPVPVPYPEPIEVGGSNPPPRRRTPLTKPRDSGNPRTKNPANDRSSGKPVIARGGGGADSPSKQVVRRPSKRPGTERR